MKKFGLAGAFFLAVAVPGVEVWAQDVVAAEALFRKGVEQIDAGNFIAACPAIAESQRLDPRPGTLYVLADCEAEAGHIATAVAHFEDYLRAYAGMKADQKVKHADRAKKAEAKKDALSAEVPELSIALPQGAPAGTKVSRDGTELSAAVLGMFLPIDPGEHLVMLEVPGAKPVEKRVVIERGKKATVTLELPVVEAPKPVAELPKVEPSVKPSPVAPPPEVPSGMDGKRKAGVVLASLGAAGLVAFGVTGGMAVANKSEVEAGCKNLRCNEAGYDAVLRGRTFSTVATVGLGVGVVGLGAGITMILLGGSKEKSDAAQKRALDALLIDAGPGGAYLGAKGAF
ncbi:hypothetical protein [Polyangium fumosum]|uniref:Tetratricopeptide repeat protein n=1 Tax=Polyangium fumosum TaxID=889272 RepID=A0A4U1IN43_9BACT|nr:hypothetical protein [Polyangium fumosum]TKC95262.1 hypothetical protein E8A74_47155 [Polyangium fumosum]